MRVGKPSSSRALLTLSAYHTCCVFFVHPTSMALFEAQPPRPGQRPSLSGRSYPPESDPAPHQDEDDGPDKKRRRVQRACDMCRLKKGVYIDALITTLIR